MTERGLPGSRAGSTVVVSLASQAVYSANSLILTIVAVWQLDARSFGWFGLMFATFTLAGSVLDAFVGEARAVLDINNAGLRGALFWTQSVLVVLGGIGCVFVASIGGLPQRALVVGGLACACWVAEAAVRRVLSARLAFTALIVNDLTFVVVAISTIAALSTTGPVDLTTILAGWAIGSIASVGLGALQMQVVERDPGHVDGASLRTLASFGTWRVLQSVLRPMALLIVRLLVLLLVSAEAVAEIEVARVVAAPISTIAAGAAQFLLPQMARHPSQADALMRRAEVWLASSTLAYGVVVVSVVVAVGDRITWIDTELVPGAVVAWVLVGAAMALGMPATSRLVALRRSREVFVVRLVDNVLGVGIAVAVVTFAAPNLAPIGLGISGVVAARWLSQSAHRLDSQTHSAGQGTTA